MICQEKDQSTAPRSKLIKKANSEIVQEKEQIVRNATKKYPPQEIKAHIISQDASQRDLNYITPIKQAGRRTTIITQERDQRKRSYYTSLMGSKRKEDALKEASNKRSRILNTQNRQETRYNHHAQQSSAQKDRTKARLRMQDLRSKEIEATPDDDDIGAEDKLLNSFEIDESISKALKSIKRTAMGDPQIHRALVCVICDRFIIGKEPVCWLSVRTLLIHEKRLNVLSYEKNVGFKLPLMLRKQYRVNNMLLVNMLLSPRATTRDFDDKGTCYSGCETCTSAMTEAKKDSKPPKFSIANGWAIGHLPEEFDNVSDVVALLIAPVRPFAYILSFKGGSSKKLKGTFTFYENHVCQTNTIMEDLQKRLENQSIYCVMCGRFTPEQKKLARLKAHANTSEFLQLYTWMKKNNEVFKNEPSTKTAPKPIIIEER